jgi:DNA-binding CsgD family transcriptional regulator
MLVGRSQESARLERALDAARSGVSAVAVIEGEPGIGKTALLEHLRGRAGGMRVLETSGHELEAELPFAGLSSLLAPILERRERLAPPQRLALEAALALRTAERLDRFAVDVAVLHLLADAAEDRPLLVLADDAQWLDRSTAEALAFVARRLEAEAIAMVVAARPGGGPPGERLRLEGIGTAAARALLGRCGFEADEATARRLVDGTGGNPLALTQVVRQLSDGQRRGREPLPDPLPAVSSAAAIFGPRLEPLDDGAREALMVVAASGSGALAEVAPALAALGLALDALDAAQAAGLLQVEGPFARFCHPLARSLAYPAAPVARRRAAHRALAEATRDSGPPGRSTWHLAAAALGPDDGVADELERLADDARDRGAPVAAGEALERAAELTSTAEPSARRLLAAALDLHLGGRPEQAVSAVTRALDLTADPIVRADGHRLRTLVDTHRRPPDALRRELLAEADRVEVLDSLRAARMRVDAAWLAIFAGVLPEALALARRAHPVCAAAGGTPALQATLTLAATLQLTGAAEEADPLLRHAEPLLHRPDALAAPHMVAVVAHCHMLVERVAEASSELRDFIGRCRAAGAVSALPFALSSLADIDFRLGEWERAFAAASESVALARETGQRAELANGLLRLAQIEAGRGREREARSHLDRAWRIARSHGSEALTCMYGWSLGLLELGLGRYADAVRALEQTGEILETRGHGEPFLFPWASDVIEAYVRLDRADAARVVLAGLEARTRATGRSINFALAARCRGLLAGDEAERHFDEAVRWHAHGPALPFEEARTKLCRGERLRRAGRRVDARPWLLEAEATFDRLGAGPWLERARAELAAAGQRARRRQPSTAKELTPQELQVALAVADGATNREVAAALFLSTKTVEAHLGRAYRKLGVRSRAELTATLLQTTVRAGGARPARA